MERARCHGFPHEYKPLFGAKFEAVRWIEKNVVCMPCEKLRNKTSGNERCQSYPRQNYVIREEALSGQPSIADDRNMSGKEKEGTC